jgi:DNA-3-methyladenine glycosylase II
MAYEAPAAAAIAAARAHLAALDPALARLDAVTPAFEWRHHPCGFAALVKMVVGQQVSTASATAIWARLEAGLGEVAPAAVLALDEDGLKAFGLSRPKARYARAIAEATFAGLDFTALRQMTDKEAVAALVAVKGVGRWTAEIYMMFCEGRLDVFPGADIALQEAMRWADGLPARPTEKQAYARAEVWAPYRSVAAHLLWRCYGGVRRGEIAPFA